MKAHFPGSIYSLVRSNEPEPNSAGGNVSAEPIEGPMRVPISPPHLASLRSPVPWAGSSALAAELAATGERLRRRQVTPTAQLTPQEFQIGLLVAQGSTNKEVAAAQFLSTKTVEFHLRNLYVKLGVRSRTELANISVFRSVLDDRMVAS